jgi:hypothetical protein
VRPGHGKTLAAAYLLGGQGRRQEPGRRATSSPQSDLGATLIAAASLMAAAALVGSAGVGDVSLTVHDTEISLQVPTHVGDEPTRADVVTAYARVLSVPVRRNVTTAHTWIEARGVIGAHQVHMWTIANPTTTGQVP